MFEYKCDKCGQGVVKAKKVRKHNTKIDGIPFSVENAVIGVCNNCGAKYYNARETKRWRDAFFRDQLQKGSTLTSSGISTLRGSIGLTVADLALLIGCSRQALYLWESPNRVAPQSRMADLLIQLVRESFTHGSVDVIEFLRDSLRAAGVEPPKCSRRLTRMASQNPTPICPVSADAQDENFSDFDSLYQLSSKPTGFSPRLGIV
jgi:DNA-binding transcriptional regulator YiaG